MSTSSFEDVDGPPAPEDAEKHGGLAGYCDGAESEMCVYVHGGPASASGWPGGAMGSDVATKDAWLDSHFDVRITSCNAFESRAMDRAFNGTAFIQQVFPYS